MADPDQCAIAADGSLLDASAIKFYNDPDDDTPLPAVPSATPVTTSTQVKPVHPFFQGGPAIGKKAAESRRSTRITDPNNMEALASTTRKRSATTTGASAEASLRASRRAKPIDVDDEIEYNADTDHATFTTEVTNDGIETVTTEEENNDKDSSDIECIKTAYLATKAMGDADREVSLKFIA
jgi:hypothetical protein